MPHLCGRPLPGSNFCNLGRETAIQKMEWREDGWLTLAGGGRSPLIKVPAPELPAHPWPEVAARLPFDSIEYATPRMPSESVIRDGSRLRLLGMESIESIFEQAMLARRLTKHQATVTTRLSFEPRTFQHMAGLAAYYNEHLFHYLYFSHDEELGSCLQIHSCDEGASSFPLGKTPLAVPQGDLFLRARFDNSDLQFSWSADGETYHEIGPVLDAALRHEQALA